jgi:hypothetical protein
LQAAFEGAEQECHEDGKGENPLPGKGLGAGSMRGDEIGIAERLGDIGDDDGMNSAKRSSWFYPLNSKCYITYFTTKSLT